MNLLHPISFYDSIWQNEIFVIKTRNRGKLVCWEGAERVLRENGKLLTRFIIIFLVVVNHEPIAAIFST
jgi:hypothetical protein